MSARSTPEPRRRRIRFRTVLLCLLLAGGVGIYLVDKRANTPRVSTYVSEPMLMQHSRDEYAQWLYYYLVPATPEQVRAALQAGLDGEGYAWAEDRAPLNRLSSYWVNVAARHRPEVRKALLDAHGAVSAPLLDEALAQGVITAGEKAMFGAALAEQGEFDDDTVGRVPFFTQPVQRWRFRRSHGRLARYDDEGGLMDVAPMLGQTPMTLVWFTGTRTIKRYRPHLFACMTGVTCLPAPGVDVKDDAATYVDPGLDRRLHEAAVHLHAVDAAHAKVALRDFFQGAGEDVVPALQDGKSAPVVALSTQDLPADEAGLRRYDDESWRLLALPDGSVLAAGLQSRRYALRDGKLDLHDESPVFGAEGGVRIDAQGMVWGFTWQDAEDGPKLVRWTPGLPAARPITAPYRIQDWTLVPGHGIGLREGDDALHVLDAKSGRWSDATWNVKLRSQVSDSLDRALPGSRSALPIHFHDGLLWDRDRDLFGVSPLTGKVAATARLTTHSHLMTSAFFGSREGAWAIAITDAASGQTVYRLFDLGTGEPRADLLTGNANYPAGVARTAHGRLLATAGGGSAGVPVTVFDTRTGQPLANLAPPAGYAPVAVAFSWKGDGLWVYLEEGGVDSRRKLAWWPVPEAYRDAAAGEAVPDQLRCDQRMDACKL